MWSKCTSFCFWHMGVVLIWNKHCFLVDCLLQPVHIRQLPVFLMETVGLLSWTGLTILKCIPDISVLGKSLSLNVCFSPMLITAIILISSGTMISFWGTRYHATIGFRIWSDRCLGVVWNASSVMDSSFSYYVAMNHLQN